MTLYIGSREITPSITTNTGFVPEGTIEITNDGTYDVTNYEEAVVRTSRYHIGDRVIDYNYNDIGMVVGFFTDDNNQKYAVVCLNGNTRTSGVSLLSTVDESLPDDCMNETVYSCKKSGTYLTSMLRDIGSDAVDHCDNFVYYVDGFELTASIPNVIELIQIMQNRELINSSDPTEENPIILSQPQAYMGYWTSNTYNNGYGWVMYNSFIRNMPKSTLFSLLPVLEIPLED